MTSWDRTIHKLNRYQQRHKPLAFVYAVLKKYSEEKTGNQAALLTYYGFLSLFPLLLVLITISERIIGHNQTSQATILKSITDYFPILGAQLTSHIHGLGQSGAALIVGILFTMYGAQGVAQAFIRSVQHSLKVPVNKSFGFPTSLFKNLGIIIIGGLGFITASIVSGVAAAAGHGLLFRVFSILINALLLYVLFNFLLNISLPKGRKNSEVRLAAALSSICLVILQIYGGYILSNHLKTLDELYSYFAITLGLLFWIYLQAQLFLYSIVISYVHTHKQWPRSIEGNHPTAVDIRLKTS